MSGSARYRIDDEPSPGRWARFAVNPLWPLLALMLGGSWFGLPWFAFNAVAVGSPTRRREISLVVLGFAGSACLAIGLLWAHQRGLLSDDVRLQYALLLVTLWKLAIGYLLFNLQSATIEIYEYYGGVLRNGLPLLLIGSFLLRAPVVGLLPYTLWRLTMG